MRNEMVTVLDLGSTKVAGLLASLGENDDLKVHGAAIEGWRAGGDPRIWHEQRLPHVPHPWPPLA